MLSVIPHFCKHLHTDILKRPYSGLHYHPPNHQNPPFIGTAPLSEKVDVGATQTKLLGVKNATKWPWRPLHGRPGKGWRWWHWVTFWVVGWQLERDIGWHWVRWTVWQVECSLGRCGMWPVTSSCTKKTPQSTKHSTHGKTNIAHSPFRFGKGFSRPKNGSKCVLSSIHRKIRMRRTTFKRRIGEIWDKYFLFPESLWLCCFNFKGARFEWLNRRRASRWQPSFESVSNRHSTEKSHGRRSLFNEYHSLEICLHTQCQDDGWGKRFFEDSAGADMMTWLVLT